MKSNEENNSNQTKEENNTNENLLLNNLLNNNDQANNLQNKDDEMDDSDNLKYIGFFPNNNNEPFQLQRLDSTNSPINAQYKFSIDMPNVTPQRLNEFLNFDLLHELDSPSISKLNSGISENSQNSKNINEVGDNNPNNLYGFSLYPQTNNNNNQNMRNENYNYQNSNINNDNIPNIPNNFNYNFSNSNNNAYYQNINNHYMNLNYNINNPPVFVPTKLRKNENPNKQTINNKKENQNNGKNKFDNNKKNKQKNKKFFEVREGDWRCNNCNNLNFSFRNKCNRCGLPKEYSQNLEPNIPKILNQNAQFQFMNGFNPNFFQGNNNINVNYQP